ncbi:MAG: NnrU family protein [Pseudomonadota bacterium]
MTLFLIGLVIFFGTHAFTTLARGPRDAMVAKLGANGYKGLYAIVALAGFAMIVVGWREASVAAVYTPPYFLRHLTLGLMLFAMILLVAAYAPPGRIAAATKHPMLAGVKVWAFAHLLANGELRSVILFGAFLAYAVIARIALKKRDAPIRTAGPIINDAIAVSIGLGAYVAIYLWLHPYIAGVAISF